MSSPTYLDFNPAQGFIGAQLNTSIFFRIEDVHGIDLTTLNVFFSGIPVLSGGVFQTGYEGIITPENSVPNAVSVHIHQIAPFVYSEVITINSEVSDLNGENINISYPIRIISDPSVLVPLVVASPHGNIYNTNLSVELTCNRVASIYYTLDGSIPGLLSNVYTTPIPIISDGETVLKFIAVLLDTCSREITETYIIDTVSPQSRAIPAGGSYFNSQQVSLVSDDLQAMIYYTLDGTTPTTSSLIYANPISVPDNKVTTINFFAVDKAGNRETIQTEIYNIEISKNNYIPTNIFVTCPFNQRELHIRWDNMHPIYNQVIGYNVYRADVESGPYQKLNSEMISITQYVDKTLDSKIINEDVSEQFRRTVNISKQVNDNFESTGPFDKSKWLEIDPGELLFQYNGLIFKDATGLNQISKLVSKFKLRGNFEIKVKYDLFKWTPPSSGTQSCSFVVKKNDLNYIEISRSMSHLVDLYCTSQHVNGNPELPLTLSTSEDSSEFRIVRNNDIITTYFYDHITTNYIQLGAFDKYTEDLYIEFVGKSGSQHIEFRLSDFVVVAGNPIIIEPLNPRKEHLIYLSQRPVVDDSGTNKPTDNSNYISVTINGKSAYIRQLQGLEGLIELETNRMYDEVKKVFFTPPVPDEFSTVLVTYRVPSHTTNVSLRKNYFYKVTCVTSEDETDLDLITPEYSKPDKLTYIVEEAVRRNAWLLDQGGERVLLYIKKKAGVKCHCTYRDMKERTHKQPDQDCETCFGSGFVGGFDGPFPVIIAPLTTEQRVQQTDRGLKLAYQIETWLGPSPIISQRDMIIRRNGDRCLVGPLTPVEGPGGVIVQQHFVVEILDSTDVRYRLQVVLPDKTKQPGIDKSSKHVLHGGLNVASIDSPKEREELFTSEDKVSHQNENVDSIVKGRNIVFENIEYLLPLTLLLLQISKYLS
jgi:hypothetical protein